MNFSNRNSGKINQLFLYNGGNGSREASNGSNGNSPLMGVMGAGEGVSRRMGNMVKEIRKELFKISYR